MWLLLICGTFTLAACGGTAGTYTGANTANGTGTVSSTPDAATILQRAQAADVHDEQFNLTINTTVGDQHINGTGTGVATRNPDRVQFKYNFTINGQPASVEVISDAATKTNYTLVSAPGISNTKYVKTTAGEGSSVTDFTALNDYSRFMDAKLIGAETVNGVDVWHLQQVKTSSNGTSTTDLYFRIDNYYPVKYVVHAGATATTTPGVSTTGNTDVTIDITKINSGVSVSLPTSDNVQP
jgi:hypothetical protein